MIQAVQSVMVEAWMNMVASEPRSMHFMTPESSLLSSLEQAMKRYLKSVETTVYECDQRYYSISRLSFYLSHSGTLFTILSLYSRPVYKMYTPQPHHHQLRV